MSEAKPSIVVVDLDGTLCNGGHREHHARAGEWDKYHSMMLEDEPWEDVKQLVGLLNNAGYLLLGLTTRPEKYHAQTSLWLARHDIDLDDLLMRPNDDWRQSEVLKPELLDTWLEEHSYTHSDVWFCLEDRDKVVEQWRNLGHTCFQPRPGGY